MLQKFKITSYAIIFFLFVISFGLATTGSKAEAQLRVIEGYTDMDDKTLQRLCGNINAKSLHPPHLARIYM